VKREKAQHFIYLFRLVKIKLISLLILSGVSNLYAQDLRTLRQDTIRNYQFLLPETVELNSIQFAPDLKFVITEAGLVQIDSAQTLPIIVTYRVLSPLVSEIAGLRSIDTYDPSSDPTEIRREPEPLTPEINLFSGYDKLYRNGAITRGVTVGNQQNLFVNSTLNLQLQGEIADDLMLSASITDQNIPFQPEGNTQQLRDFDNVFIELEGSGFSIAAGDIVMQNSDDYGHYLKYLKNQQGFQASTKRDLANDWKSTSKASIAIAEGQFASTQLTPIEGVQGPYRLRGAQNERFVTIIANSERVFLDGERLDRGFDQDYIIDYNLGEVIFTSQVVITRFSRLRVDYEYAQQNYVRSNLLLSQHFSNGKHRLYFDYFRSADNESRPLQFDLGDEGLNVLSATGDPVNGGVFINSTQLADSRQPGNYYLLKDTIVDGQTYPFFEYIVTGDSLNTVVFTDVGQQGGDYVLSMQNGYGRIFSWIAPANGVSQGQFVAQQQIITPNAQQMAVLGAEIAANDYITIVQELALSTQDQNLYSANDDSDNIGIATRTELLYKRKFNNNLLVKASVGAEYHHPDFRPIDRFRSIEFDRDWNYPFPYDSVGAADRYVTSSFSIKSTNQSLSYRNAFRDRVGQLTGIQHFVDMSHRLAFIHYTGKHFLMNNSVLNNESVWRRSSSDLFVKVGKAEAGVFYSLDQNMIKEALLDSIIGSAMYFFEQGVFVRSKAGSVLETDIRVSTRKDQLPKAGDLRDYTEANQAALKLKWNQLQNHNVQLQGVYRATRQIDSADLPQDNIIQGSLISQNSWLKGLIKHQLNYMTQNSRELRREFIYTQVGAGQGTHTWRDENGNGIAEIEEFYLALNQDEKNYIRLFTPTDEYIEAFQTTYQQTLNIGLQKRTSSSGAMHVLSRLSALIALNVNQKLTDRDELSRINPFGAAADTALVFKRSSNSYTLFYNRNSAGLGLSASRVNRSNKQLNVNGFELSEKELNTFKARYNFSSKYQIELESSFGTQIHAADFLSNRNFELDLNQLSGQLSWMPKSTIRLNLTGTSKGKFNQSPEGVNESVQVSEVDFSCNFISSGKRNLTTAFNYSSIAYSGEENTFLSYTLLEALQPGDNFRLNVNLNQTLRNGLQLSLNYFGRKSGLQELIHTGSVNLTAFF
jgi:hypothetical protein